MPSAERLRTVVLAGHAGDVATARAALRDPDAQVRAVALGALARADALEPADLTHAFADPDPAVRRRAADEAARQPHPDLGPGLLGLTHDADITVVESAAFALGEADPATPQAVDALTTLAQHEQVVIRETAVAALGSLAANLDAVLRATEDVATVRRRAVLALAAFDDPRVEEALERLTQDRDRQVRQSAEDLLNGWGS